MATYLLGKHACRFQPRKCYQFKDNDIHTSIYDNHAHQIRSRRSMEKILVPTLYSDSAGSRKSR